VQGEVSNLARPASGHLYFSLKDGHAQVRCALFRMRRRDLRFQPADGMEVVVRARISLYEARGEYQLIVEHMEPAGEGALRQAFEELKRRLAAEGLFDPAHKKPLPRLPHRIGVITSPTGAAIRDVLTVLQRRFPGIPVVVYPVPVQGAEAPAAIAEMLRLADRRADCDVLLLTRGGGSLEDLMAFNDEGVARAIFESRLPVVAGVGHEIDFTIADLVADERAPTPSAAAELLSPDRDELAYRLAGLHARLCARLEQQRNLSLSRVAHLERALRHLHPLRRLQQYQQRADELEQRLAGAARRLLDARGTRIAHLEARLYGRSPAQRIEQRARDLSALRRRLQRAGGLGIERARTRLAGASRSLDALSPLGTLSRGYSITRRADDGRLVRRADEVAPGDRIETRLGRGRVLSRVEGGKQ
jgi:exodeoxyribonuclease VII large subunit